MLHCDDTNLLVGQLFGIEKVRAVRSDQDLPVPSGVEEDFDNQLGGSGMDRGFGFFDDQDGRAARLKGGKKEA